MQRVKIFFLRALQIGICLIGLWSGTSVVAEPAQAPLLTRSAGVDPNILLMFDDSGSMVATFLYQESSSALWSGTATIGGYGVQPPAGKDTYAKCSPDINRLYYNPAVQYKPRMKADGSYQPAGGTSTARITAPCSSGTEPNTAQYTYRYKGGNLPFSSSASYVVNTLTASITSYPRSSAREDCGSPTAQSCTYLEEMRNFANWSAYHRSRLDMARTAVSQAFADFPPTIRLGWAPISLLSYGGLSAGVSAFNSASRVRFYTWLESLGISNSGTPSRRALDQAGRYFSRDDSDGPWGTTPNYQSTSTSTSGSASTEPKTAHAACRRSYSILLTDGYYNDSFSIANFDNTPATLSGPNGAVYRYQPGPPFSDGYADTIADVAMKYWITDLRPGSALGLANSVKTITEGQGDPAFWQHMNFYAISLGLTGTLPQTTATLASLRSGALAWPRPAADTLEAVDDLWHATVNGRGEMLNARDAAELSSGLRNMVGKIDQNSASQAGVAVSTVNLVDGTKKFVPVYRTGEWTGNLIAVALDAKTGNESKNLWQVETRDSATGAETSNTLGSPDSRNIVVGTASQISPKAAKFAYDDMKTANLTGSMTGTVTPELINYLRGDRTNESRPGTFRPRVALLGDIVNSTPALIGGPINYGYDELRPGPAASSYKNYVSDKLMRKEAAVFVGANDGMLHVFNDSTGNETFAYVPRAVLPQLAQLADRNYAHRYYVDGPVAQGDFHDGVAWRTVAVATTGAGAKAVFAIDATTLNNLTAQSVLWEVNDGVAGFDELGYVLSEVQTGKLRNGEWAAIFGNGYSSKSGSAQLFIVNLNTGALIKRIDTSKVPGNGLGGIRLVLNSQKEVIGAYGGDLLGNLWKFDLADPTPGKWQVGLNAAPLFVAKTSKGEIQPMTAAPYVVEHPAGGYVVAIGTGKLFESGDVTVTSVQTVYGLRDAVAFGSPNVTGTIPGTVSLQLRSIADAITVSRIVTAFDDTTSSQVISYYSIPAPAPVDWTTKKGWYFDLTQTGQRTVYPLGALYGPLVRVETLAPNSLTVDPCTAGGWRGYNYLIDVLAGGSPNAPILDTDGNGVVDSNDVSGVSGYSTSGDGRDIALLRQPASMETVQNIPPNTETIKNFFSIGSGGEATLIKLDLCKLGYVSGSACTTGEPPGGRPPGAHSIIRRSARQLYLR